MIITLGLFPKKKKLYIYIFFGETRDYHLSIFNRKPTHKKNKNK